MTAGGRTFAIQSGPRRSAAMPRADLPVTGHLDDPLECSPPRRPSAVKLFKIASLASRPMPPSRENAKSAGR